MPLIKARSSSIMENLDLRGQPAAPTATSTTNTTQIASTAFVKTVIAELVDSSPALLDTLNELAAAIGDDPNFATTVANSIATKVPLDGSVAMTGELTLSGAPTQSLSAVTKQYVDDAINNQIIYSTDDVTEGTTNLYYTDGRVRSAVSLSSDNTVVLDYDSTTGQFTYNHPTSDGVLEGTTNLYFSEARARSSISINSDDGTIISYSSVTGEITFTTPDTDKIVEGGTNLYFTTARARNTLSGGSNINYDPSTGIISTQAAVWSVNGQTNTVALDTDNINEGSTNLYFTDGRVHAAISLTTDNSNILSYDSNGTFTFVTPNTDAIAEGSTNLYYTDARARLAISASSTWGNISYDDTTGVITVNAPTTDDVTEGSTNLYYTNARARNAVSLITDNATVFTYDNTTGLFTFTLGNQTTDDVQEGSSNLYFTDARARAAISATGWSNLSYDNSTGVISITAPTTDDVTEGANLYYTDTRARASVSVTDTGGDGSLSYNSTTGTFTYTGPSASESRSHFSAVDAGGDGSFSYDSSTGIFTYTGPSASEVRAHLSATTASGVSYNSSTGTFSLSGIPNSSLTNSNITINGTTVALGASGSFTTDSVSEGTTNLYYTTARTRADVSAADTQAVGAFSYSNATGVFTFNAGAIAQSVNGFTGVVVLDTDDVSEGATNLYYTTARTRADVSGGTGVTYTQATGVFAIGQAVGTTDNVTFNDVTVSGDLTVNGTLTTVNSTDLTVTDKNITIADGAPDAAAANGAGITVDGAGATITYVSATDSWEFNKDVNVNGDFSMTGNLSAANFGGPLTGNVTGTVSDISNHTTDALAEGSTNLYFTNTRARNAISLTSDKTSVLGYNASTGVFTFTIANASTSDIAEGTNLYYTDTRARLAVSVSDLGGDGSLSYDNTTGVLTYTGPSASETRAHLGAANSGTGFGSLSYDSTTGTFTFTKVTSADVRGAVSANDAGGDGSFSYDSSTGTFTYTGPSAAEVRAHFSAVDVSGDGSFSYNSSTGAFTYTGPSAAEVRAHFSATTASGVTYNSATGTFSLASIPNSSLANDSITINGATIALGASDTLDTDDIGEGSTNLYFTDARARNAVSLTSSDLTVLSYDSSTGTFTFNLSGIVTDEVAEGSTNLYFTNARARNAISLSSTWGAIVAYNSATGVISVNAPDTDDVTESSTNLYFTNARARNSVSLTTSKNTVLSYDAATGGFVFNLANANTDDIAEGTNLYFTTARARNSISNGSNINYDASTGIISTNAAVNSVNGLTGVVVLDTDNISEGSTNLYFTDARARSAITLTTDDANILSYNTGTGLLTFVKPNTDAIAEGSVNMYYTDNRADARIAAASIRDLSDVDADDALQDGYALVWSSSRGEFVPQNVAVTATSFNFTGDGTTTSFSTGVEVSSIDNTQVFINGLVQAPTYSYTLNTVSNVTSIVFDTAPEVNDYIFVRVTSTSSLTAGGILNENSTIDGGIF